MSAASPPRETFDGPLDLLLDEVRRQRIAIEDVALAPLVAGIVIGVSEAVTMAVTAPSWAPLVSFTLLIAILLLRPGRAA